MKNNELLQDALGGIGDDLLLDAQKPQKKASKPILRVALILAACFLLIGAVAVGFAVMHSAKEPAETLPEEAAALVYLDVNPSFTLDVTKDGKILTVAAANDDAKKVLAENAELTDKDVTVEALLSAMMDSGYLSKSKNTLLLSVECADKALAETLKETLKNDANAFFAKKLPTGRTIAQRIAESERAAAIAEKYQISKGAASFLVRLIGVKEEYTEEKLAAMDITSLRRLCEENNIDTEYTVTITSQEAYEIARSVMKETMDDEPLNGAMDLSISYDGTFYWRVVQNGRKNFAAYDVDGETGEIVVKKQVAYKYTTYEQCVDAAAEAVGYTRDDIVNYDIMMSEDWVMNFVWMEGVNNANTVDRYFAPELDFEPVSVCWLHYLHTADGKFWSIRLNRVNGEILSVDNNYRLSIDMLDAVILAMDDAGFSYDIPPVPHSTTIGENVEGVYACTIKFNYDGNEYTYAFDPYTAEIISKQVTPIEE